MHPRAPAPPSLSTVADRVDERLAALFAAETTRWRQVDDALVAPLEALRRLVEAGGKRLRPAFCHWAFVGAGGDPDDPRIVDAGAAFEMLHAFALVHDDVMDDSATRRGRRAAHLVFADEHAGGRWRGEARRFGEGAAILAGDVAHVYADLLLGDVPPDAARVWHELRLELNVGQYLDLLGTARGDRDLELAHRIARYKSGKYTIERPLHVGAALAGRLGDLEGPLSAYGDPLGEAFQLRDDVLGAFGDPARTGKPVGQDLREGKPTPLLALAHRRLTGDGNGATGPARVLDRVGDPALSDDDVARIQQVLVDTGALDAVEALIDSLTTRAVEAIEATEVTPEARDELVDLAWFVAGRDA
ncbi:MAG TPA: polyprenyl synthetase family protein [Acidimicrobiales bacterium]|nr:polyprenyl synthetase family protein [Acidimicrobiales bacterium]